MWEVIIKRTKTEKGKMRVFLFERVKFSDEGEEGRSRMIDDWSRKSLDEKRHPKSYKEGVEAKYISK